MSFLKLIPLRWWLYIGAAAAIAFVLWHDHHIVSKYNAEHRARIAADARADAAEENARQQEKASHAYHDALDELRAARADTPVRVVRLCHAPAVPPASGGAAAQEAAGHEEAARPDPTVSRDIGPELYALADEQDRFIVRCNALIDWMQ